MSEKITVDTILNWLKDQIEQKHPISAEVFLDSASKLNMLIGDEQGKLFDMQQKIARMRNALLETPDMSVAKAKSIIEATDEYKEARIQEAKIKRVEESIRISKKQATMSQSEYMGNR